MDQSTKFLRAVSLRGLENSLRLFYSSYTGEVTNNTDPDKRGRIYVKVTELGQDEGLEVWVPPVFASVGANRGAFWPPEVGDRVRVFFKNGQQDEPVGYIGGWYADGDVPPEFTASESAPDRRGFVTRLGHSFVVCEEAGNEFIKLGWHKPDSGDPALSDHEKTADRDSGDNAVLEFNKDGGIILANSKGTFLEMDSAAGHARLMDENGNSILLDSEGVKIITKDGMWITFSGEGIDIVSTEDVNLMGKSINVKGAGVSLGQAAVDGVPLGNLLLAWLATHTHVGVTTGPGVSGPPIVPPTPALISQTVKVSP